MSGSKHTLRFHDHKGINISFTEDQQVALRKNSFAHAITFSSRPLKPMEIFLVEIEKNESGWSGHMRIGLTMHNPNDRFALPQYALPDLANQGRTWVYAVTKSQNKVVDTDVGQITRRHSLLGTGDDIRTYNDVIDRSMLRPAPRALAEKRMKRKIEQEQKRKQAESEAQLESMRGHEEDVPPEDKQDEGGAVGGAVGGVDISDIDKPSTSSGTTSEQASRMYDQPSTSYGDRREERRRDRPSTSYDYPSHSTTTQRKYDDETQPGGIRYNKNELAGYSAYGGPNAKAAEEFYNEILDPNAEGNPRLEKTTELYGDEDTILPTDEGSRVAIVYVVKGDRAEMHFIINGEDQGPCTRDIPYKSGPLFALVDVYGTTKQVRLIPLGGVGSLSNCCREVILAQLKAAKGKIEELDIPPKLKGYLKYERAIVV